MPHTYEHIEIMRGKVREWFGLEIETVAKKYRGEFEGLEGECLRGKHLPSLAYGGKQCSMKYKGEPQEIRFRTWMKERKIFAMRKAIGFGVDEPWRVKPQFAVKPLNRKQTVFSWYPLVEWGWRRQDCVEAIQRHGLPAPGKSSCFFCPAKKRGEVLELRRTHPHLFERGVAIERNAIARRVGHETARLGKGLHFGASWEDMANADDAQGKLFDWIGEHASGGMPCGCVDG